MCRKRFFATGIVAFEAIMALALARHETTERLEEGERGRPAADPQSTAGKSSDVISRGQYLVHHVAMCVQCHSPRTDDGELRRSQLLEGAPVPVESPFPAQNWAHRAPKIAGLPGGWMEDDMVRFLRTGKTPSGHTPKPPMPPFEMTEEDARAVAVYLRSLVIESDE